MPPALARFARAGQAFAVPGRNAFRRSGRIRARGRSSGPGPTGRAQVGRRRSRWVAHRVGAAGIELGISYIGETLGVVSGGVKQGARYEGQLGVSLDADLDKLTGWPGAKAHANAFAIHGRGTSADLLGNNLMTVSNIEALRTVRLYALWIEQGLFDDKLSIRIGQLAADAEFVVSNTAGGLINGTFGWPLANSADTIGGGPAYPLPQPGARLQIKPKSDITLRGAVFAANPRWSGLPRQPAKFATRTVRPSVSAAGRSGSPRRNTT